MANCERSTGKYITIQWHIVSFDFCWHKTGERLESPLFNINTSYKTSWNFWLYPRGKDDGEYVNCYLFRGDDGPEVVDVDFKLYISVGTALLKHQSFVKVHPFKCFQKEGVALFILRREIFSSVAAKNDNFTLIIGCEITNMGNEIPKQIICTRILKERVCGTEIFDLESDLNPESSKDIQVKPILEEETLININLSYLEESLVIKIRPLNCQEIKYAICKITVIKNWENESPIEHVRSWIGEMKPDVLKHQVPLLETQHAKQNAEIVIHKTFFLHYDFAFSTGVVEKSEENYSSMNIFKQLCFKGSVRVATSAPTALDALVDVYQSSSHGVTNFTAETKTFPVHKALLSARSVRFQKLFTKKNELTYKSIKDDMAEEFLQFFYTDAVKFLYDQSVTEMYALGHYFEVELLKSKCRNFLMGCLNHWNAPSILQIAHLFRDLSMKSQTENYIMQHYDLVLQSIDFSVVNTNLIKEVMLLKHRKKDTSFVRSRLIEESILEEDSE